MRSWQKKLLLTFAGMAGWFFGLILIGEWGYPSQYFWITGCAFSIGFGVAPFWRLRASAWYWPTVGLLVVGNLVALWVWRDFAAHTELPSKGLVQAMLIADIMASWAVMVVIAYVIDRQLPWRE